MPSSKAVVITTKKFIRVAKRLKKKYRSLPGEIDDLIKFLEENPQAGDSLGKNAYKVRVGVESKSKGKSGGLRAITAVYMKPSPKEVYLVTIFNKSEADNISDKELAELLKQVPHVK